MLWFNFQFTIFPIRFFKSGLDNQEKGDYQGAIADYTQAIKLYPKYPLAYNNRGIAYGKLEQYQRAINDYTQAIELDPNNSSAYNNRSNTYHNLEEYQRALEDYKKAAQLFRQQGNEADYQNALNQIYKLQQ